MHVGLDGVHRPLDNQLHADGGGEVKHHVAAIDQLSEQRLVVHRVDEIFEAGPSFEVRDVFERPGRQVVQNQDAVSLGQQRLGEM